MYVDVKDDAGTWLAETDLQGCVRVPASAARQTLAFHYPGYEQLSVELQANKETTIVLPRIKYLPPVYEPALGLIRPRESRGTHEIKGIVHDDDSKEPLIGASVLKG